jgi:DNA-binding transcriptional ArsR family regulator
MSVKHIGLVLDCLKAKPALKLVAIVLADHADSDGLCWPSYRKIAERTNMDDRTVRRHVKTLQEIGVVIKVRSGSITRVGEQVVRVSNAYRISERRLLEIAELSTDDLWTGGSVDHLKVDKNIQKRGGRLSTKPSMNHQSNRQHCGNVDNLENPLVLAAIVNQVMGEKG